MSSLKSFIKAIRAAKTAADERAVIQKESAAIRASFREDHADPTIRRQNISKLLYLFTLGERTHFGQIECLKLLATSRFSDKRLGYLGTMLLLDENQEVLTLVTNSLKNDLNHSNQNVMALALCTLGNIASQEMARDLFPDVEKLISIQNQYIRKKAALCAMRIIRKVPELRDRFVPMVKALLKEQSHGVLLCGLTLAIDMCNEEPALVTEFRPFIPSLVRSLHSLIDTGYSPEYDVSGIADPFLQVKLLKFLSVLGKDDTASSDQMNDILTQIVTNTDSSKNVGNSILYEAVLTILNVNADSSSRVLAINILGRFLGNRDNNVKYVGLNTLSKVIELEPNAVQRHRTTVIDCLRDADISIRRRALDLSFELINEQNVRVLVRELLIFLESADTEFKTGMTTRICIAAERYAPNKRWHIDTVLRVLKLAGNYVSEQIVSQFIALIANTENMQLYSVQKLYSLLKNDITQEGLTVAGIWIIGEYGDELLKAGSFTDEDVNVEVNESEVIQVFESVLNSTYASQLVQEYLLDSLIKLSTRMTDPSQLDRIRRLIESETVALDVEIQQRAIEYSGLLGQDTVRSGVLERMPAAEIKEDKKTDKTKTSTGPAAVTASKSDADMLLDLMGADDSAPPSQAIASGNDLLSQALGNGVPALGKDSVNGSAGQQNSINDILGLFNSQNSTSASVSQSTQTGLLGTQPAIASPQPSLLGPTSPVAAPAAVLPIAATSPPNNAEIYTAFEQVEGLKVTLQPRRDGNTPDGVVFITANLTNTGATSLSQVDFRIAVPKTQTIELLSSPSTDLGPGQATSQSMKVTAAKGSEVRLLLRINYLANGQQVLDQKVFNQFPKDLLA
ncbi:adaptin N terminal region-domain-containing protein [Lipomyces oligophaga]|uniref:adaptin N terminal region-domain-containing protein n=1 Tax=Lipomyces oligophaga TaxID=45792 RepID=UPI0034CEB094